MGQIRNNTMLDLYSKERLKRQDVKFNPDKCKISDTGQIHEAYFLTRGYQT